MALDYLALGTLLALAAGRSVYRRYFGARARARHELEATPLDRLRPGLTGAVHVMGRVQALERTLLAPLTGRPCVAFELEVEALEPLTLGWKAVVIRRDACAFLLVGDEGQAEVDPHAHFELGLEVDHQASSLLGPPRGATNWPELLALVRSMGVALEGEWLGLQRRFRFRESRLEPGDQASVSGLVSNEAHRSPETPIIRGTPEVLILLADPP